MKVEVTSVWRSVNYKARGVGSVMPLGLEPSQHVALVVVETGTVVWHHNPP